MLAGCAIGPTRVETDYGTSYKTALMNQTLNPEAEKNPAAVAGMDSASASATVKKYQKSFEKEEKTPSYIFNLGSMGK